MDHAQELLYSDAKVNLMEIVTQNKDVINSKLNLELNDLTNASIRIAERLKQRGSVDDSILRSLAMDCRNGRQPVFHRQS